MKKFLSVILSAALIITPAMSTCYAYTSPDRLHLYSKSSNREEKSLCFTGRETPCNIVINNTANAKSESAAKATADSSKSSTSSKIAKILLAAIGIGVAIKIFRNTDKKYEELVKYMIANKNSLQEKISRSLQNSSFSSNSSSALGDGTLSTDAQGVSAGIVSTLFTVVRENLLKILNVFKFLNITKSIDTKENDMPFSVPVASSSIGA